MKRLMKIVFIFSTILFLNQGLFSQPINGIWTSVKELTDKPKSGPAWQVLFEGAQQKTLRPNLADQNDHTGVFVLAKAIVYVKTGNEKYKSEALQTIQRLVAIGMPGGRTLAWGRNIAAYVMAADLLGYRTSEFESYIHHVADVWRCAQIEVCGGGRKATLREMFEKRPSNWGSHAFASLAAIYRYLGKMDELQAIHDYWVRSVDITKPRPECHDRDYGKKLSKGWANWQTPDGKRDPRWILPQNAKHKKCGINLDGIIPDDMDRGAPFACHIDEKHFHFTKYVWEGLQGLIVAARILDRAGLSIWEVGDKAIYRAAYAAQVRLGFLNNEWKATSKNVGWLLVFLDDVYGTDWLSSLTNPKIKWGYGRGAGWGYVLNGISKKDRKSPALVTKQ